MRRILLVGIAADAFARFFGAVKGREDATRTLTTARQDADFARVSAEDREVSALRAEEILDDAQTEYESASAELTRALGGKVFDPDTGDLI